jgi:hypothetical protein
MRAIRLDSVLLVTASMAVVPACTAKGCGFQDASAPAESAVVSTERAAQPIAWQEPVTVASGQAFAGPWRMNESEFHYVDDPSLALHGDGSPALVWVDNQRKDVLFQSFDATGRPLASPVNVSRTPEVFSWLPRVVTAGQDEVFVLWQEIVFSGGSHGGEIFFARSGDGGKSFSEPINLSNTMAGCGKGRLTEKQWDNGSLDLIRGPAGELFVAWTEYEGPLRFSRSTDGGRTFSAPLQVGGSTAQPARGPTLAIGAEGPLYLAWAVGEDPEGDIQLTVSNDRGQTFSPPEVVLDTARHSDAPKLAVDGKGGLHLVYHERSNGLVGPSHIQYARRTPDKARFEEARTISGPSSQSASFPALGLDRAGNVYVAWEHHPRAGERASGLGWAMSPDNGGTFFSPTLVPGTDQAIGTNGSRQGKLMRKLDVNANGHIGVVNSRFQAGVGSVVRLVRGRVATE